MALHLRGEPTDTSVLDLPWDEPLATWSASWLVGLPRGISRHVVRFVRLDSGVFAVKEIGSWAGHREYDLLRSLERAGQPAVHAVGVVDGRISTVGEPLETALDRALLSQTLRPETAGRLLDALAVLLVRLHLGGFYWGDCSLSNTLFRRDAGSFSAYLVDAETMEQHPRLTAVLAEEPER